MSVVKILFIANAGILIDYQGQQILIDALHEGHRLYPGTPAEAVQHLLDGHSPFTDIQALLFTHNHLDHFSARLVLAVLHRHQEMEFISDESSAAALLAMDESAEETLDRSRIHSIPWNLSDPSATEQNVRTVGPFSCQPIAFTHEGRRFTDVANVGFLVTVGGLRILFPGDARITPDNFAVLSRLNQPIDVAVLMFPYIATSRGQNLVRDVIKPRRVVVVHWPDPARDSQDFIRYARKYYEKTKDQLMETHFLENYLESVEIEAD